MTASGEKTTSAGFRLGYACINTQLREGKPSVYASRTCVRKTVDAKGVSHAGDIILANCRDLYKILQWNEAHDIRLFRVSSSMCPWATLYNLRDLPQFNDIARALDAVGRFARRHGHRLSFHPGQFNVLTSPHEHVIQNTLSDLELHGELMDLMAMPRSQAAKINIHIGGTYGDKQQAMERFCRNWDRLSHAVRDRLTVENDDKASCYSVDDLVTHIVPRTGSPVVFDYHHYKFCPGEMTQEEAARAAAATWPDGVRPTFHYSEGDTRKHSDYYESLPPHHGLQVDLMLECKMKEQALIRIREDLHHVDLP